MMRHILAVVAAALAVLAACSVQEQESVPPTDQADSSGSVTTSDGTELAYLVEGSGRPCIVISSPPLMARSLSPNLRNHVRFVFTEGRMNLPSEELSDIGAITMDTFVDDIEAVRAQLGLDRVVIFGHSISGIVALEYARKYPQNTSHVVMHATPPFVGDRLTQESDRYWDSHASDERKAARDQNWAKLTEEEISKLAPFAMQRYILNGPMYFYDPDFDPSPLLEGDFWNDDVWSQLFGEVMTDYDLSRGEPVASPVFLALGRSDFAVPYYVWDDEAGKLEDVSVNLFEESGHYSMLEEQELFDGELIEWLNRQ